MDPGAPGNMLLRISSCEFNYYQLEYYILVQTGCFLRSTDLVLSQNYGKTGTTMVLSFGWSDKIPTTILFFSS